jgi:4-aminobutyrate aminotransferase-like enzyme
MPSMAIDVEPTLLELRGYLDNVARLDASYAAGEMRARTPEIFKDLDRPLEEVIASSLPASHALLENAKRGLFYSLPVAFDPLQSFGCYLATVDKNEVGEPYRFLDMGAQIATRALGENDPRLIRSILRELPCVVNRYAHSEYQTHLSLRMKAALDRIAPYGTRHFVVNTGAEAVENAIKSVLLIRATVHGEKDGGFVISFEGAFHGRTLGALAVTHRKKAKLGFPTFDWPQVIFPVWDPRDPKASERREERSLRQIWELLSSGRSPGASKSKEAFHQELERIDRFLTQPAPRSDVRAFVDAERALLSPETKSKARRAAGVLIEPIQGEGGVRMARPEFFRRLRVLTLIYDVPLIFDEVQTGFGATGKLWAHMLFDLPAPPDVVTWAKKAQNGVLFVSEELATFFQEEKKFNTTWEGDSVGMARFLAMLEALDLDSVVRTGEIAKKGLEKVARAFPELISRVRGEGVMLAFDVARSDWRDVLRDRAFRRGLILLPAGDRALRFYPRYDTPARVIEEALSILENAVVDIVGRGANVPLGPRLRVGTLEVPLASLDVIDLDAKAWNERKAEIMALEIASYGVQSQYPPDVLRSGHRPLIQYSVESLDATIAYPRSAGVALHDRITGRAIAFALGAPLENYDEDGVIDDPHYGENQVFYMQAMATLPTVRNQSDVANHLLEELRKKIAAMGYVYFSSLLEAHVVDAGPLWVKNAKVLKTIDNYLRTGIRFAYVQADLDPTAARAETGPAAQAS